MIKYTYDPCRMMNNLKLNSVFFLESDKFLIFNHKTHVLFRPKDRDISSNAFSITHSCFDLPIPHSYTSVGTNTTLLSECIYFIND